MLWFRTAAQHIADVLDEPEVEHAIGLVQDQFRTAVAPVLYGGGWDVLAAIERGFRSVQAGVDLLAIGEMGIGNTTPAACLGVLLCDASAELMTGRGAGADDETLARNPGVVDAGEFQL